MLVYEYGYFACIYVYGPYVCLVHVGVKDGVRSPGLSYRWLWAVMWLLRTKHGSSASAAPALNAQVISLIPPYCIWIWI